MTRAPGPWRVRAKSELDNVHRYPVSPILASEEQGPGVVYAKKDRTRAEADACIIPAAPELLAATVPLLRFYESKLGSDLPTAQNAIAAIAKATGGASDD